MGGTLKCVLSWVLHVGWIFGSLICVRDSEVLVRECLAYVSAGACSRSAETVDRGFRYGEYVGLPVL
jgi:hypothetical protein